jgi:hypothetical protein
MDLSSNSYYELLFLGIVVTWVSIYFLLYLLRGKQKKIIRLIELFPAPH